MHINQLTFARHKLILGLWTFLSVMASSTLAFSGTASAIVPSGCQTGDSIWLASYDSTAQHKLVDSTAIFMSVSFGYSSSGASAQIAHGSLGVSGSGDYTLTYDRWEKDSSNYALGPGGTIRYGQDTPWNASPWLTVSTPTPKWHIKAYKTSRPSVTVDGYMFACP